MFNANMITEEQKEKHYTVKEAVERVGCEYSVLNKACHNGRIKCSPVPSSHGTTFLIAESDLVDWNNSRMRRTNSPTKALSDLSVEDLAAEIMNRIQRARDEGYRQGRKDARAEFMSAFKDIK